jgi:hypothetical protein
MKGIKKEYDYLNKQWELRNTPGNNAIESEAEYRFKAERRTERILTGIAWGLVIVVVSLIYLIVKFKILG